MAGVQTGTQGVLALGVGAGARAAGGRGAQALGRAGRVGVRGHADGRCRQMGAQARERGRGSTQASGSMRDERMSESAGARWLRCDTTGGFGHDTARPPTTRPRARGLCAQAGPAGPGWGFVHSDSVFGPVRLGSFLSHQMNNAHCKINFRKKK